MPENLAPLTVFRFRVDFFESGAGADSASDEAMIATGNFAECSGLEATIEPKTIKVGGQNYGAVQRPGRTNFATVVLKRGVTTGHELWDWFYEVAHGDYSRRLDVEITVLPIDGDENALGLFTWKMVRAMPTKFKTAELSAKSHEVGVEELHFVHEGMTLQRGES